MDVKVVASQVVGQMANAALPFSGPVAESLVQELLGAQNEQIKLLRTINSQLDRLVKGPWQTARMFLQEAALPRRTPQQVAAALRRASKSLHNAVPLQPSGSLPHAQVLTDLAIVELMRGDRDVARHYALEAYYVARVAMGDLVQESRGKKGPDRVARLTASGSIYDDTEWTAAVIADSRAATMLAFTPSGLTVRFPYTQTEPIEWDNTEPLDFAYIAWFNYLRQWIRTTQPQTPASSGYDTLDLIILRFINPEQVRRPDYPPLPPMGWVGEWDYIKAGTVHPVINELRMLGAKGKLP